MDPAQHKGKQRRSWWTLSFLAIAGLGLLLVVAYNVLTWYKERTWFTFAGSLQKNGEPLTFFDIKSLIPTEDTERSVTVLLEPFKDKLAEIDRLSRDSKSPVLGSVRDPWVIGRPVLRSDIEAARRILNEYHEIIPFVRSLQGLKDARYLPPHSLSDEADVNYLSKRLVQSAAQLLYADSFVAICGGDVERAMESMRLIRELVGTLQYPDFLPGVLIKFSIVERIGLLSDGLLKTNKLERETLVELRAILEGAMNGDELRLGLCAERADYITRCEHILAQGLTYPQMTFIDGEIRTSPAVVRRFPRWVVRSSQRTGARMFCSLIENAEDPVRLISVSQEVATELDGLGFSDILAEMFAPRQHHAIVLYFSNLAQLRCRTTAIACELFRLEKGNDVQKIEDLVPAYLSEVPIDPFSGQPIRLKSDELGLLIFSIGSDMIDDGGAIDEVGADGRTKDIGTILIRQELRVLSIKEDAEVAEEPHSLNDGGS